MGHSIHGPYTVDFMNPKFAWDSVVTMADTYECCMLGRAQIQFIDRVVFEENPDTRLLVSVYARHGRVRVRHFEVDLRLDDDNFNVTPETATAGRLFRAAH